MIRVSAGGVGAGTTNLPLSTSMSLDVVDVVKRDEDDWADEDEDWWLDLDDDESYARDNDRDEFGRF